MSSVTTYCNGETLSSPLRAEWIVDTFNGILAVPNHRGQEDHPSACVRIDGLEPVSDTRASPPYIHTVTYQWPGFIVTSFGWQRDTDAFHRVATLSDQLLMIC